MPLERTLITGIPDTHLGTNIPSKLMQNGSKDDNSAVRKGDAQEV